MTIAKLTDALAKCSGGETIDATGWAMEPWWPKAVPIFAAPVTIHGGLFSVIGLSGISNLNFEGGEIALPNTPNLFGIRISGSSTKASRAISFRNMLIHGPRDVAVPSLELVAFFIDGVDGCSITDSELANLRIAISWRGGKNLTVAKNHIHHCRTDAIRGEGYENAKILDNLIHDMMPPVGDHPDAIQVWTPPVVNGVAPAASNLEITRNIYYRGDGAPAQGVFLRQYEDGRAKHKGINAHGNIMLGCMGNGMLLTGEGEARGNAVVGYIGQRSWLMSNGFVGPIEGNTASFFSSYDKAEAAALLPLNTKVREDMTAAEAMAAYLPKEPPPPPAEPETIEITLKPGQKLIVTGAA